MVNEKVISSALKCFYKNRANAYPCPDCGRIINKSTAKRHGKTIFHTQAAAIKALEAQVTKVSEEQPVRLLNKKVTA